MAALLHSQLLAYWTNMLGQHKRVFELVPYQSAWIDHFGREADRIRSALGDKALQIVHIGSTSIPGMAAKPIIDIMVAVEKLTQSSDLVLALDGIGYDYFPVDTVAGRMFFAREIRPEIRTHHLNLAQKGSEFWENQLLFRDYLRENDQLASEYIRLKKDFAEYYARTNHLDREWKSEFVAKVLELAEKEERESS
jgi:GrpB-like predicted nucleotidyltransferase (UPF0157 family)